MENQNHKITFQEIMEYGPDNKEIFTELVKLVKAGNNNLLPFVGAGLSDPIYPLWGTALHKIGENFHSKENRDQLDAYLKQWDYLGAAEFLEQKRKPTNLARDFEELFSPEKLLPNLQEIRDMPVWLLPMLFKGNAITTNLDRILEYVYDNQGLPFKTVCLPGERTWLFNAAMKASDAHNLYKLHGSVEADGRLSYDKAVFSKTQYDKNYKPDSGLVKELSDTLKKRTLLFLGCSLEQDRTLEITNQVKEPGTEHYAILPCAEADIDDRIGFLGELHIRAIIYPDGKFEAVRILLEQLLAETDPDAYQHLPLRLGAEAMKTQEEYFSTRFQYDAGLFSSVDRPELEDLEAFLKDEAGFRWWAMVGPGGVGKSRLALTLTERLPEGWSARFLNRNDYMNDFKDITARGKNLLFIADYVQAYTDKLGSWIDRLASMLWEDRKVRLLLLEREGGDWEERLRKCFAGNPAPTIAEFRREKGFLTLETLGEESLLILMERFSQAVLPLSNDYTRFWDRDTGRKLLETLEQVDPGLRRPLFALFLTDSWLMGQDPESWNREALLVEVLGKEERYIRERISKAVSGVTEQLEWDVMWVLRAATVLQDVDTENLAKIYPNWDELTQRARDKGFRSAVSLLGRLGLCQGDTVLAMRPDILGEYFVLHWVLENQEPEDCREFLNTLWNHDLESVFFWDRVVADFKDVLDQKVAYWEALLPDIEDSSNVNLWIVFWWLANKLSDTTNLRITQALQSRMQLMAQTLLNNQDNGLEFSQKISSLKTYLRSTDVITPEKRTNYLGHALAKGGHWLDVFKKMFNTNDKYGKELLKLTNDLYSSLVNTVDLHKLLPKNWLEDLNPAMESGQEYINELVQDLAQSCIDLANTQFPAEIASRINYLEAQAQIHPTDRKIALELAEELQELAHAQNSAKAKVTLNRLEALSLAWPEEREIALLFATGLFILAEHQEPAEAAATIDRLEILSQAWSEDLEIALLFARGLLHLSIDQESAEATLTIGRLVTLAQSWKTNHEIALGLAMGLANLIPKQKLSEASTTIGRLETLAQTWQSDREITLWFAKGLAKIARIQKNAEAAVTYEHLKAIAKTWSSDDEIVLECAGGLFMGGLIQAASGIVTEPIIHDLTDMEEELKEDDLLQMSVGGMRYTLEALMDRNMECPEYQNLPVQVRVEAEETQEERFSSRFQYDAGLFSSVDRPELDDLEAFLADEAGFSWWCMIGPCGVGKSRLALTLTERLPEGWSARFLSRNDYMNDFPDFNAQGKNLLFIADYVQAYTDELGSWIDRLAGMPWGDRKIRLLLLEREGGDWEDRLRKCFAGKPKPETAEFRREKGFLTLEALGEESLLTMMERFSQALGPLSEDYTRSLDRNAGKKLLETLEQVDPGLRRPLFALFLTDSWMMGMEPENWNRETLLGKVLDKEERYIRERITRAAPGSPKQLEWDVMWVLRAATVMQDAKLEELAEIYPDWEGMNQRAKDNGFHSIAALLERLGLCRENTVQAIQPDILGEYFVLRWILENRESEGCMEFLNALWTSIFDLTEFWDRVASDFKDTLDREPTRWETLLPDTDSFSSKDALPLSMWLVNATARTSNLQIAEAFIGRLEALSQSWPGDRAFELELANGLVNLINLQEPTEASASVNRLEALSQSRPGDREIGLLFAKGLFNLANVQEPDEAIETVNRLEILSQSWPKDREIALVRARGLFMLSLLQDDDEANATIKRLESLVQEFHGDREIVLIVAKGLSNLSLKQEPDEVADTENRLKGLTTECPGDREIMIEVAHGLFTSGSWQQTFGGSPESALRGLKDLEEQWKGDTLLRLAAETLHSVLKAQIEGDIEQVLTGTEQFQEIYSQIEAEIDRESY